MTCKYAPVPKEDTYALIKAAQEGREDAKALLVEQNAGLVKKIARKFSSTEWESEDLIQIGYMGLLKAIEKFNPEYDVMFSTYAVPMIMGEIKRFFRDNGKLKVSRTLKTEVRRLRQVQENFAMKEGHGPKLSQLAEAMEASPEHILELMEAAENLFNVVSLDQQLADQDYAQTISGHLQEPNLDIIMMKQEMKALTAKERQVILFRYYRDMTQQEIGLLLQISQVQVSRIEKKALEKMRKRMCTAED